MAMIRLGDLIIACIVLAITFPLMLMAGVAIRLESSGPILARHNCIGHGGRRLQMLKFRTNVHSPQHLVTPWVEEITGVARLLRYTRIDALPQLINVLRGEMSIIDSVAYSPSFLD
jgi:lipopolysaccharide/colanic/teichoic acid biosynthesis glycosyltransferase